MISSIVFVNSKGEILIYRVYKDDITYFYLLIEVINLHFLLGGKKQFNFARKLWQPKKTKNPQS